MTPTRREFLTLAASALPAALALAGDEPPKTSNRMGVVIHSYPIRSRVERDRGFADPLKFVEFCRERGAGGVQLSLGARDADYTRKLRALVEKHGMYLEGSLRAPRDKNDLDRFEAEVKTARDAGVGVLRTVMLSGRRYETFKKAEDYRDFKAASLRSLELAGPVLARHKVKLGVENHKDYRAPELVELMKKLASEWIGVCLDTGNNIALLEEPQETTASLAPWVVTCHVKDMAVEESADGFLLSEVPLGEGILDLKKLVATLRKARPEARLGLEMLTRDPLRIPCLKDGYWATFADVPGRDLARTLALVRKHSRKLPRITTLSEAEQLKVEDENVRRSLEYAGKNL